jgi:hypothetical protein
MLISTDAEQKREQRLREQEVAGVRSMDLSTVYYQINNASFGGELLVDTPVYWEDLSTDKDCHGCGAMTDFDTGRPRIRFNPLKLKTRNGVHKLMQHEMCHVYVYQIGEFDDRDPHGPQWAECMKRFP